MGREPSGMGGLEPSSGGAIHCLTRGIPNKSYHIGRPCKVTPCASQGQGLHDMRNTFQIADLLG